MPLYPQLEGTGSSVVTAGKGFAELVSVSSSSSSSFSHHHHRRHHQMTHYHHYYPPSASEASVVRGVPPFGASSSHQKLNGHSLWIRI
ncbi:hypothetical protein Tco_0183425 [Tanacetum coccineum]